MTQKQVLLGAINLLLTVREALIFGGYWETAKKSIDQRLPEYKDAYNKVPKL